MKPSLIALTTCLVVAAGCHRNAAPAPAGKQYEVRGKVMSTDPAHGEVTLDSQAIPGFMDAMVMPYKLRDPGVLSELHPGDSITAQLFVTDTASALDQIVITAQGKLDYVPPTSFHVLKPGDAVPDFKLLNQDGRQIHLAQFHGKTVLLTFIYTRCPLPDFCPRMSRNFAEIDKQLAADPSLYAQTHLLSISFDPDYDTPPVLRSYGGGYTGKFTKENFAHWDFAAPSKKDLAQVTEFFDIGITPEKDKTITHSLSTVIIGPDGKVFRWYPTNDWQPADLVKDVKQLAQGAKG